MHLTQQLDYSFNDFIVKMINNSMANDMLFMTDPEDDNNVESLSVKLNKIDDNNYELSICYQDECICDHGVYGGKCYYDVTTNEFTNCILNSKYDNIDINVNQILNSFFKV